MLTIIVLILEMFCISLQQKDAQDYYNQIEWVKSPNGNYLTEKNWDGVGNRPYRRWLDENGVPLI